MIVVKKSYKPIDGVEPVEWKVILTGHAAKDYKNMVAKLKEQGLPIEGVDKHIFASGLSKTIDLLNSHGNEIGALVAVAVNFGWTIEEVIKRLTIKVTAAMKDIAKLYDEQNDDNEEKDEDDVDDEDEHNDEEEEDKDLVEEDEG